MSRRPTRQRVAVTEEMGRSSEFRSAQEVHAALGERGETIGLATVYRALQAMAADEEVDVVRADDGEARYRLCSTGHHHHHLVCRVCGRTEEIEGPEVERWARSVADRHGFTDIEHVVELFGTCRGCSS